MRAAAISSVLCSTHGGTPQFPSAEIQEFPRIKPDLIYYSPALQRRAPDLVRSADVLHGHGFYVGTNFIFGRESRRQKKPLVYHVHGIFEPYILARSRWKKRLVHWIFEDANFKHARLWRALTQKEAGQIRDYGITAPIVVAPNGLDLSQYARPQTTTQSIPTPWVPQLPKTRRRVLFLGRIHPKKGLNLLVSAWQQLGRIKTDWELVIAGPDDIGHLAEIKSQIRGLKLGGEIIFTGPMTGPAKLDLLYSADLFVLPSYSEGFSMGILEALACGVPVLATRACNFPEISQSQAGWECEPEVESVLESLRQALQENDTGRAQRGQIGRRLIEQKYCWPAILPVLLDACATHCQ